MLLLIPGMQVAGLLMLASSMELFLLSAILPNQGFLGMPWQLWGFLTLIFAI